MDIELTNEQNAIIQAVKDGKESLVANSGPGSGKTFTNVKTMIHGGFGYKTALAFNKTIADELATKAPPGIIVRTAHSVGRQMIVSRFRSTVNSSPPYKKNSKHYRHVQQTFPNKLSSSFGAISSCISKGMDGQGFGVDEHGAGSSPDDWKEIVQELNLEPDEKLQVCQRLPQALLNSIADTEEIHFSDMLIMPLVYKLKPQFYQTRLWGDEIQDWSPTQLRMTKLICSDQTLFYGFGDKYQSIYAFRGADIHAVENCRDAFNAIELPLTQSFRCPKSVIRLAQQRNPALTCPVEAPEGTVDTWDKSITNEDVNDDTMVICRMNAPLFSLGLKFLSKGQPCRISSNLPNMLKNIIRTLKTNSLEIFTERLEVWLKEQIEFAGDTEHLKTAAHDKYNALHSLISHSEDVWDMDIYIDKLTRGSEGPLLCTVHKAKGLEASRVFLLKSKYLLAPGQASNTRDLTEDELEQEWNMWFVAITRTKSELFFA